MKPERKEGRKQGRKEGRKGGMKERRPFQRPPPSLEPFFVDEIEQIHKKSPGGPSKKVSSLFINFSSMENPDEIPMKQF